MVSRLLPGCSLLCAWITAQGFEGFSDIKAFDLCAAASISGRELHVVVNTHDPDYEHIYSIEALDDPADEQLYLSTQPVNQTGADQDDGKDSEKTVRTKASKSASADIQPVTATDGEKAVKNSSVRSKRRVKEEDSCLLSMDEGSCKRYTLRWYFSSQAGACRPFIYSGCGGNSNRFLHQEECEELCLGKAEGPRALKPAR